MANGDQAASNLANSVSDSHMKSPGEGVKESGFTRTSSTSGAQTFALSVATVIKCDYAKHEVTLRTVSGDQFEHIPIPMSYPSAGKRHFLGALPLEGDSCVIGWGVRESGHSKSPFVLSWLIPGATAGHDWWVTQPVGQDEFALTQKDQVKWGGIVDRARHKLRHMIPGNIVATSAQGADLVLSEGVLITDRRGDEIRLRDQDQAIIFRSKQQFHAGAGFRVYGGMVQRDAVYLPTQMFSDGAFWDAPQQLGPDGTPLPSGALGTDPVKTGFLTPNEVFQQDATGTRASGIVFGGNSDPYIFLQKALLIDAQGRSTGKSDAAIYSGKAMFRVGELGGNAVTDAQQDALTEYRIEVSHTSDGTMPVTEQTDGFDADRLPDTLPRLTSPTNDSINAPFVEFVLGSPVGNDAFSVSGKALYGRPLRPVIFTGNGVSPALTSGFGSPLTEHAAVLLRVSNPQDSSASPTFLTFLKDGRLKASVAGPGNVHSAELAFGSGIRIATGKTGLGEGVRLDSDGQISLKAKQGDNLTGRGIDIASEGGAVRIYGGISETVGGIAQRTDPIAGGESSLPAVTIESGTNLLLKAVRGISLTGNALTMKDATTIDLSANSGINLTAGDSITETSKTRNITSLGKTTETYSGPKDGLPTNGPVRDVTIAATPATGFPGGTADKYTLVYGDRTETITVGNHSTSIGVGNMTYTTGLGNYTAGSAGNKMEATPTGLSITAAIGPATFTATAGSASVSGTASVVVSSTGPATLRGSVVTLLAPNPLVVLPAGIISGADLDSFTGTPMRLLGMGSPTHLLGSV